MKIAEALQGVPHIFLDTAPVIYYVEGHPSYAARTDVIFERLDRGEFRAVTSPITLAECLIIPYRANLLNLVDDFIDLIVDGSSTTFVSIDQSVGHRAAELRARYNLSLTDALQIATALGAGCEALLTNDSALRRVDELRVLVLDELEL
ncbi:MAG: type II toxin-antitoxin system VapC family toxin [Anaerolineae bacterium]